MKRKIIAKLISVIITLCIASILVFVLIRLSPGDPVKMFMGMPSDMPLVNSDAYEARVNELRAELGLDKSIAVQYIEWIKRILRFDMGTSIYTGRPVGIEIAQRLPATLILSCCALLIQFIVSITFGVISALKSGTFIDSAIRFICVFFASAPGFVTGLLLLFFFAVTFHVYEISNSSDLSRLWLPALTLGLLGAPQLTRMVRACMLSEFGKIYLTSVIARGLPRRRVILNALRNALLPITTMLSHTFAMLMGGSVIIENIFTWPGIGKYALTSVLRHDYPVIQAYAIITVSIVVFINLVADLIYTVLDPKIKTENIL